MDSICWHGLTERMTRQVNERRPVLAVLNGKDKNGFGNRADLKALWWPDSGLLHIHYTKGFSN
jgi:hypothetical protein